MAKNKKDKPEEKENPNKNKTYALVVLYSQNSEHDNDHTIYLFQDQFHYSEITNTISGSLILSFEPDCDNHSMKKPTKYTRKFYDRHDFEIYEYQNLMDLKEALDNDVSFDSRWMDSVSDLRSFLGPEIFGEDPPEDHSDDDDFDNEDEEENDEDEMFYLEEDED